MHFLLQEKKDKDRDREDNIEDKTEMDLEQIKVLLHKAWG